MSKKRKNRTDEELVEQIFDNLRIADDKLCELYEQNPEIGRYAAKVVIASRLALYGAAMMADIDAQNGIESDGDEY